MRIRGALENCGIKLPSQRGSPSISRAADLKKDGAAFDVPIAVGMLCAAGVVPSESVKDALFIGELALDGGVRPVRGILPIAAWARHRALKRLFVPRANALEASVVAGGEHRGPGGGVSRSSCPR